MPRGGGHAQRREARGKALARRHQVSGTSGPMALAARAARCTFVLLVCLCAAGAASAIAATNPLAAENSSGPSPTFEGFFANASVNHTHAQFVRNSTDLYKGTWNLLEKGACFPWPKFRATSGTLTLEFKQRLTISSTFDAVLGELSFRDGPYSTDRQVGYEVQGLHFHSEGFALLFANRDDSPALKDVTAVLHANATAKSAIHALGNVRALVNITSNETLPDFLSLAVQFRPLTSLDLMRYPHAPTHVGVRRIGRASPQLFFGGLAHSSNCSVYINITGESYVFATVARQALNYVVFVAAFAFAECLLLIRQMDYTESQVSLMAIGQQTVMDSYLCLIHLTVGVVFDDVFNAFAFAAFLKFIVFALFEMRYLMLIWKSRRPNTFDGWGGVRRELSQLYTRFYLGLLSGLLAFYFFGASAVLVFTMYSFWVPQIWRTAIRGERGGILPKYAIGVSLTRLFIPIYFYLCPANLLHAEPRPIVGLVLAFWVCLQTAVVLSQEQFGARFFIPSRYLPPRYDYHRPLLPNEHPDCVICMSPVATHLPAEYMVTPCGHVFHQPCLLQWISHKLECPTCRTALPVFDER